VSAPLVAFDEASVILGRTRVLDRINLEIAAGDRLGLVGESGSGKTTLCRALLGLVRLSEGDIRLEGRSVGAWLRSDRLALRRKAQMLLQDAVASLSPRMRLGQAMEEPLRIHGIALAEGRERLDGLLRRLRLPADIRERFPHQISGGQARRVGIARALVVRPQLIAADEPTAGLDLSVRGEVLNLLLELGREFGLTYLLVSHDLTVVRRVTDRTAVLYLGQIIEEATTESLFERPAHPYSASLLSLQPTLDPLRPRQRIVLKGEVPSASSPPSGCRFHTRCPAAAERCGVEMPELRSIGIGRRVRCHFPFVLEAAAGKANAAA